uniref:Uncharacterized protein n=1 Tax=Arundo donax TaxID=35708 RepID=A0A0A9GGX7_ARUDO
MSAWQVVRPRKVRLAMMK